jgi:hypothetical protein
MRSISKFLILLVCSTALCLYYVSQQNQLLSLSYEIGQDEYKINNLLDQNNLLLYNTYRLKSPNNLEEALVAEDIHLTSPEKDQIVYLADTQEVQAKKRSAASGLLSLLSFTRRAEAESLKKSESDR